MQKQYSSALKVRERYGNISEMTLWRWLADPDLNFPRPVYIRKRRFWDDAKLDAFDAAQAAAAA